MESSSSLLNLVKAGKTRLDETTRRRASSLDGARSEPHLRTSRLDRVDTFEREVFHLPMQALARAVPGCHTVMTAFGATCTGEGLVCAFAFLGWCLSVRACIDGIWLVPIVEVLNGLLKWGFGRPRPGWNDARIDIRSVSHEYSFPSSHAMLSWSLTAYMSSYWMEHVGSGISGGGSMASMAPWYALHCMAFGVSISRVFEGAHYPKDIVVGGAVGYMIGTWHYGTALPFFQSGAGSGRGVAFEVMLGYCGCAVMLVVTGLMYKLAVRRWGKPPRQWDMLSRAKGGVLQPHFVPLFDYVG